MRKEEYLQKLERLLYNIPAEDRNEAIQFYRDYLEDKDVPGTYHALFSIGGKYTGGGGEEGATHNVAEGTKKTKENTSKGKLTLGQWILLFPQL